MNQLFNGNLKYLFLIPIIILIGFSMFYQKVFDEIHNHTLSEKMIEKRMEIDIIATSINNYVNLDHDWDSYDYMNDINVMIEELDAMDAAFAVQLDQELSIISNRATDSGFTPFNPLDHPNFVINVTHIERGNMELLYDNGQWIRPMHLYYRWVPDDKALENRSLLVIGSTQDSVAKPHAWLMTGIIVLIAVSFLVNMAFVVLLCYLGTIYKSRSGSKWRPSLEQSK